MYWAIFVLGHLYWAPDAVGAAVADYSSAPSKHQTVQPPAPGKYEGSTVAMPAAPGRTQETLRANRSVGAALTGSETSIFGIASGSISIIFIYWAPTSRQ